MANSTVVNSTVVEAHTGERHKEKNFLMAAHSHTTHNYTYLMSEFPYERTVVTVKKKKKL